MSSLESARIDEDEIHRQLPEIELIGGSLGSELVYQFKTNVPRYFWISRGARSHHHESERGLGGLLLHTKRVFFVWCDIFEQTFRAMNAIDAYQANCARTAILIHDAFKYGMYDVDEGLPNEEDEHPYANGLLHGQPGHNQAHDTDMADFIRDETSFPEEVARCVESHGGSASWDRSHNGPTPSNDLELAVHLSDMTAANHHVQWPVYGLSPELREMVGDVPEVGEEWAEAMEL